MGKLELAHKKLGILCDGLGDHDELSLVNTKLGQSTSFIHDLAFVSVHLVSRCPQEHCLLRETSDQGD